MLDPVAGEDLQSSIIELDGDMYCDFFGRGAENFA
jgi:hypothetical protein